MEPVKAKKNWKLTERDFAILKHIGEYGFSSARWIKDQFWSGKANCIYYRRLSILRKMGLVEHMIGDGGNNRRMGSKGIPVDNTAALC